LARATCKQMGLDRVIHHVEHDAGLNLVVFQRAVARVPHAHGSGIDDDIEANLSSDLRV
jgi:hypothetical protein